MRTVFLPSLLHEPFGDPGVWVDLQDEGRSILLDLGALEHVSSRRLLRVERALVSHTHMDHFVGFDHLLRLALGREKELVVTGPPGFLDRVAGKMAAYTWNLIADYPVRVLAEEVDGPVVRSVLYEGANRMEGERLPDRPFHGTLHAERLFTMHVTTLDHGIPVLAAALHETEHLSINRDRLDRMGLASGSWLRDLKESVRHERPGEEVVHAPAADGGTRAIPRAELAAELVLRSPGQRIAYVTDAAATADNAERIAALARGVDLLVCEAAFLHEDEAMARARRHLTARQAGEIACAAGAQRLAPVHFSPRYTGRERELLDEAQAAFGGAVVELPTLARFGG